MTDARARPQEVVGIDVGGTKTRIAVGRGGTVVTDWTVPTLSWRTHSVSHNAATLPGVIRGRLGDAALSWPLVVGAHGCDSTEQCDLFAAELSHVFTGGVLVVNDAELLVPAAGRTGGIGMVAGTGSIAVARDMDGRLLTAGGWGWVLGDEGGAAGLVREAARAVLDEMDWGRRTDPLARRLLDAFDATDGPALALAVTESSSAAWLGERVIEVFHAADEGSALGARVVADAARELAGLVDRLLGRGVAATELVAGGTVMLAQARLREAFLAAMGARHPDFTVHILDRPPVLGAVSLAERMTVHSGLS